MIFILPKKDADVQSVSIQIEFCLLLSYIKFIFLDSRYFCV